jgi:hypothetical protein
MLNRLDWPGGQKRNGFPQRRKGRERIAGYGLIEAMPPNRRHSEATLVGVFTGASRLKADTLPEFGSFEYSAFGYHVIGVSDVANVFERIAVNKDDISDLAGFDGS